MDGSNQLPPLPRVAYGIWLPGHGWLKATSPSGGPFVAYAEPRKEIALRYARWIGNGARVEPVDMSLVALESELKRYEKERKEYPRKAWIKLVEKWKARHKVFSVEVYHSAEYHIRYGAFSVAFFFFNYRVLLLIFPYPGKWTSRMAIRIPGGWKKKWSI